MNFLEQFPELIFEFLILFPLVEFADKMTTGLEDVNAKLQSSMAKVLVVKVRVSPNGRTKSFYIAGNTYHAPSMVSEDYTAGVHHPVVRLT